MSQQRTPQLYEKRASLEFYDDRYTHGYMEAWPIEKRRRVGDVIRNLDLPPTGDALDFGCGNGVLTEVLREAFPAKWNVHGADISAVAIGNARKQSPSCTFFLVGDLEFTRKRFDFLFTHHVLEHVHNLDQIANEMNGHLNDRAAMLHILPCGNEGSYEHGICVLRRDGISPRLENRFFFEEEGHLRRLTTEQVRTLFAKMGFMLRKEYYSNQYFGALNWITRSGPGILRLFADTSQATDEDAKRKLKRIRNKLITLWAMRYPAAFVEGKLHKNNKTFRDYALLIGAVPLYPITKPVDVLLRRKAHAEWQARKEERNGSEMYLFFER